MIKYIFCINTGRCGSKYLTALFSNLINVNSQHEPHPQCIEKRPRIRFWQGDSTLLSKDVRKKLSLIQDHDGSVYIETSHAFIHSFGWLIPEQVSPHEIGLIVLKRNKNDVVKSYISLNTSPFNYRNVWLIMPSRFNVVPPPGIKFFGYNIQFWSYYAYYRLAWKVGLGLKNFFGDFNFNHLIPRFIRKYEKEYLEWYYDETYRLGDAFVKRYPAVTVGYINTGELNDKGKMLSLLKEFGLSCRVSPEFFEFLGTTVHDRTQEKDAIEKNMKLPEL